MKKLFTAILALGLLIPNVSMAARWHVDTSSTAMTPLGTSWNQAFTDLQTALDSATTGDTIWVSEGIYLPDRGTLSRDSSFVMKDGVVILGGFSVTSNDTTLNRRNYVSNVTILSGEIQQDSDSSNNSYIIVKNVDSTGTSTEINGFTITGANNTNTTSSLTEGGGMFNTQSSPKILNCIFTRNTVYGSSGNANGAGIFNFESSPTITNCTFTYNKVYCNTNVLATGHNARGGGLYNSNDSSPRLTNCVFSYNEANGNNEARGGAIYSQSSSLPILVNCIITYNESTSFANFSFANGAGVYNEGVSTITMENCLIAHNTITAPTLGAGAIAYGAGICNFNGATFMINNCTVSNNTAIGDDARGGGIWNLTGHLNDPEVNNSIVYGNTAATAGANVHNQTGGPPTVPTYTNSDVGGCGGSSAWDATCGVDSGGNIDVDPFFVDATNNDFTLDTCSPAFNAGKSTFVGTTTDLAGNDRFLGDSVDMGAYEKDIATTCLYTWDGSADTSWATAANWDRGSVPPDFASVNIPNVTKDPILDMDRVIGSLTLEASSELTLNKNTLEINGNLTVNGDGAFKLDSSIIEFAGDQDQDVNGDFTIDTIVVNCPDGVDINSGSDISIKGEIRFSSGFINNNGNVTLLSDSVSTARVGEISIGTAFIGDITCQKFIKGTINDWRLLSSPVFGATLESWDDDFATTGFPGSSFPSFGWVNTYTYNETVTGTADNGFEAPDTITDVLSRGEGFMVYLGGTEVTIDVTGDLSNATINLTTLINYTVDAGTADDGWNLVGNPMPSDIDFGGLTHTGIDNEYYVYDPATGNYASWDEDLGTGTLGADGNIAQAQGFFIHATAASPTLLVPEASKTRGATTYFSKVNKAYLSMTLHDGSKLLDESIIRKDDINGNFDFDQYDTRKFYNGDTTVAALASFSEDDELLSINTIAALTENTIIPLRLNGKSGVTYTLKFKGVDVISNNACVVLEDTHHNKLIDLSNDTSYTFTLPISGGNEILQIRITPPPAIEIKVNNTSFDYTSSLKVCDEDDIILFASGSSASTLSWNNNITDGTPFNAPIGKTTYEVVEQTNVFGCQTKNSVEIEVFELPYPEIAEIESGKLETGKFKSYQWYVNDEIIPGATTQTFDYNSNGIYSVFVTNENDCSNMSDNFDLHSGINSLNIANELILYPNPGKDVLNIRINTRTPSRSTIEVTDVIGKVIITDTFQQVKVMKSYDLQKYESGIYFITVTTGDRKVTKKWIKN